MTKDFGVKPYLFPMPVYMIGTYNEDGTVDEMAMAWGGICAEDMVALNLEEDHKTVANLKARGAFTLAIPGTDTIKECDFMGTASANKFPDKFARTGLHAVKSERVDAPVVREFPVTGVHGGEIRGGALRSARPWKDRKCDCRRERAGRKGPHRQRQAQHLPL